jgi:hypothetical protein
VENATVDALFDDLCAQAELPAGTRREEVRRWALSGVERLGLPEGATMFFKFATVPFADEARVLRHVARHGVPVPLVLAAVEHTDALGMLLEDLGDPVRPPTLQEAAQAAVATHCTPPLPGLPLLDDAALAQLPSSALTTLTDLREAGRWQDTDDIHRGLDNLHRVADERARDAELLPFGLCHSEFHPTSLHVTPNGWRLLDWARAFHGPGLLDLASWQGTTRVPDLAAFDDLLDAYAAAGGPPEAHATRGGLAPGRWAFGWHRLWVIDWYLQQCTTWINNPTSDPTYQRVVRRHLAEALECLQPTPSPMTG